MPARGAGRRLRRRGPHRNRLVGFRAGFGKCANRLEPPFPDGEHQRREPDGTLVDIGARVGAALDDGGMSCGRRPSAVCPRPASMSSAHPHQERFPAGAGRCARRHQWGFAAGKRRFGGAGVSALDDIRVAGGAEGDDGVTPGWRHSPSHWPVAAVRPARDRRAGRPSATPSCRPPAAH